MKIIVLFIIDTSEYNLKIFMLAIYLFIDAFSSYISTKSGITVISVTILLLGFIFTLSTLLYKFTTILYNKFSKFLLKDHSYTYILNFIVLFVKRAMLIFVAKHISMAILPFILLGFVYSKIWFYNNLYDKHDDRIININFFFIYIISSTPLILSYLGILDFSFLLFYSLIIYIMEFYIDIPISVSINMSHLEPLCANDKGKQRAIDPDESEESTISDESDSDKEPENPDNINYTIFGLGNNKSKYHIMRLIGKARQECTMAPWMETIVILRKSRIWEVPTPCDQVVPKSLFYRPSEAQEGVAGPSNNNYHTDIAEFSIAQEAFLAWRPSEIHGFLTFHSMENPPNGWLTSRILEDLTRFNQQFSHYTHVNLSSRHHNMALASIARMQHHSNSIFNYLSRNHYESPANLIPQNRNLIEERENLTLILTQMNETDRIRRSLIQNRRDLSYFENVQNKEKNK